MTVPSDLLEPPARRILDRGRKTLEAVLRQAGSARLDRLQTSINEVGFLIEAARLAAETLDAPSDEAETKLNRARLRGIARIVELRQAAEPCLETGEVCKLLGVSRETVRKKVDRNQLLALPKGGDRVFPSFQFQDGDVIPGLGQVLSALDNDSPFTALSFLLSTSPSFGNRTAIEALLRGEIQAVLDEALSLFKHGA